MLPTELDVLPLSLGSGFHATLVSFSLCLFFQGHKIVVFGPVTTLGGSHWEEKKSFLSQQWSKSSEPGSLIT